MSRIYYFIPMIFVFISCKSTLYTSPDEYPGQQVIISEGGGFTGQTTQHIILDNGQVFVKTIYPAGINESKKLKKKTTHEIFEKLNQVELEKIDFKNSGNITYSLASRKGDAFHEVKWGEPGFPPPALVLELYQFIRQQVNP